MNITKRFQSTRIAFLLIIFAAKCGLQSVGATQLFVDATPVERLAGGFGWAEGPAYDGEGGLWFTDLRSSDQTALPKYIYRHDIASLETELVVADSGGANGLLFDRDGRFLSADGASQRLVERDRTNPQSFTVLADDWQGTSLNGPNDLIQDSAGGVYFTDPNYESSHQPEAVYYLDPSGELAQVAVGMGHPNGIGLSANESTLYVVANGERRIYAFDVTKPGVVANRTLFRDEIWADGMTVDRSGNLYVSNFLTLSVEVISPHGERLESIFVGEPAINVELVGDKQEQLYITARTALYRSQLTILPSGDFNGDEMVGQADLDLVLHNWGIRPRPLPTGWTGEPPIRFVDQDELDKVLLGWGTSVEALGAASVPEPPTFLIACLALITTYWRRWIHTLLPVGLVLALSATASADIFRWDNGELIPGTEGIEPTTLARLSNWDEPNMNLQFANFDGKDLRSSSFGRSWLQDARFVGANLANASFFRADLSRVDFSNANLHRASLDSRVLLEGATFHGANIQFADLGGSGISAEQIYSTASYQSSNLVGVRLDGNDLSGWDFSGQDLTRANLSFANLTDANFTNASINHTFFRTQLSTDQLYSTASYRARDLRGVGFGEIDLAGFDLSEQDLTDAYLFNSDLRGADLTNATINGARFGNSGISQEQLYSTASFKQGDLSQISLGQLDLSGWDFGGITLDDAGLNRGTYRNTNFGESSLIGADLSNSDLSDANFAGANLSDARFGGATLAGADFSNASFQRAWFAGTVALGFTKEQLYSTSSYRNADLRGIRLGGDFGDQNDLTEWDFSGQDLTDANFQGAILAGTDFTGALITGASFEGTTQTGFTREQFYSTASYQQNDLSGIRLNQNDLVGWDFANQNLVDASMFSSNMSEANLRRANLSDAFLRTVDLSNADLVESVFTGAKLDDATFTGADLTGASISGVSLRNATAGGLTMEHLYSTASYAGGELTAMDLRSNNFTGWDFSGQDLTGTTFGHGIFPLFPPESMVGPSSLAGADLSQANLGNALLHGVDLTGADFTAADLTGADLRGAIGFVPSNSTVLRNTILPDARIKGIGLTDAETLHIEYLGGQGLDVRHDIAEIQVADSFTMESGSELEFEVVIDDDVIGFFLQSKLVVPDHITPRLGGTLRVGGAFLSPVPGRVLDLFDWNQQLAPDNRFDRIELGPGEGNTRDFNWDISQLYTTGEVEIYEQGLPDYNANGFVDQGDLDVVLLDWGSELSDPLGAGWYNELPTGIVDQGELDAVLLNWGGSVDSLDTAAVPEPTTLFLAAAGILAALGGYRVLSTEFWVSGTHSFVGLAFEPRCAFRSVKPRGAWMCGERRLANQR